MSGTFQPVLWDGVLRLLGRLEDRLNETKELGVTMARLGVAYGEFFRGMEKVQRAKVCTACNGVVVASQCKRLRVWLACGAVLLCSLASLVVLRGFIFSLAALLFRCVGPNAKASR